jgi:hypothetical protein
MALLQAPLAGWSVRFSTRTYTTDKAGQVSVSVAADAAELRRRGWTDVGPAPIPTPTPAPSSYRMDSTIIHFDSATVHMSAA